MKIKTLSKTPFLISWSISILLYGFTLRSIKNSLTNFSPTTEYIFVLILVIFTTIILYKLFTGELILNLNDKREQIEIKWNKKPLYSKIDNQTIKFKHIKELKKTYSKITDRLSILLLSGEKIKIDFDTLTYFGKNSKKREVIINHLNSHNITCN